MLIFSALLFVIGLVGFITRRNMIVIFLCTELMFLAVPHWPWSRTAACTWMSPGQVFVIFILTVAAAEAALALGLVILLYPQTSPDTRCGSLVGDA